MQWSACLKIEMDKDALGDLEEYDICQFIGNYKSDVKFQLYFDTNKYKPPPMEFKSISPEYMPAFNELKNDIERAAAETGSSVIANGSRSDGARLFCCERFQRYQPVKGGTACDTNCDYRQDSIVDSDKAGRRPSGRAKARRSQTSKAVNGQSCCPFKFVIGWDEKGYYLLQSAGNHRHVGHPKTDPEKTSIATRLLSEEEKEALHHQAEACAGSGVGRNYIYSKLGRFIDRARVAYIQSKEISFSTPIKGKGSSLPINDVEQLIEYLKSEPKVSCQVLWDVPVQEEEAAVQSPTSSTPTKLLSTCYRQNQQVSYFDHTEDAEMDVIRTETASARSSKGIANNDKIFLCVAWAGEEELRLLKQFPEVVYLDATSGSNRSHNHLITFSGRTSTGRQFIILRIWVHNQKRSTFHWIFQSVLSNLIPDKVLLAIKVVLVDGDPQQRGELEAAIRKYLHNAIVGTCGWHLVFQGYKRYGPKKTAYRSNPSQYDAFEATLKNWLFSWMRRSYCETEHEYHISKTLFFRWLRSRDVLSLLGADVAKNVEGWVRDNVVNYQDYFVYYKRMNVRYFFQCTTSPHEGTNFGAKAHSAAVRPNQSMVRSAKALCLQATMKTAQMGHKASVSVAKQPLWSQSATANHLCTEAESMILQVLERIKLYTVSRTDGRQWQVELKDQLKDPDNLEPKGPIPRFRRVRTVIMDQYGNLTCTCCHFECTGIPCVHTGAVIGFHYPTWKGFTHHDIGLCWWKLWHRYAFDPKDEPMSEALQKAKNNEVKGPSFPGGVILPPPITGSFSRFVCWPVDETVTNYPQEVIGRILGQQRNSTFHGLSQASFVADDIEDNGLSLEDGETPNLGSDILKHDYYELLNVLKTYESEYPERKMTDQLRTIMNDCTNKMRADLHEVNHKKKRAADGISHIVNIMSETRNKSSRRSYHSKNC
jgi:hypothetical protein